MTASQRTFAKFWEEWTLANNVDLLVIHQVVLLRYAAAAGWNAALTWKSSKTPSAEL